MAVALPSESCQLEYRIRNRFSILHYKRIKKVKVKGGARALTRKFKDGNS
jgi:hypothetical protein